MPWTCLDKTLTVIALFHIPGMTVYGDHQLHYENIPNDGNDALLFWQNLLALPLGASEYTLRNIQGRPVACSDSPLLRSASSQRCSLSLLHFLPTASLRHSSISSVDKSLHTKNTWTVRWNLCRQATTWAAFLSAWKTRSDLPCWLSCWSEFVISTITLHVPRKMLDFQQTMQDKEPN